MSPSTYILVITFAMVALCYGQNFTALPTTVPSALDNPDYCNSTTALPKQTLLNCSSCKNRCNDTKNFSFDVYCSCDTNCVVYGDCCSDFEQACPSQFNLSTTLRAHFQYRKIDCYKVRIFHEEYKFTDRFTKYNFVAVCGETGTVCNRTSVYNISTPNTAIPVTDSKTGINYVNYQCARCNNVIMVIPWTPIFFCDSTKVPKLSQNETFRIDTEEKLGSYLPLCSINYVIPQNVRARPYCVEFNKKCPSDCNRTDLVNRCENSYSVDYVRSDNNLYDNLFCALCAEENVDFLRCAIVPFDPNDPVGGSEVFSLSILFDFNPSEGVTVGRKACSEGQKWIAASQDCRQVTCPGDLRLVDEKCLAATLNMTISASLFFNFTQDLDKVIVKLQSYNLLTNNFTEQLKQLLNKEDNINLILNETRVSDNTLNVTIDINILFSKNSSFNFGSDLNNFSETIIHSFQNELELLVYSSGVSLGNVVIIVQDKLAYRQDLLMDCTWFSFSQDEFVYGNGTITMISSNISYKKERYRLVKDKALICISNEDVFGVRVNISRKLGLLTLVLMLLSIICLTVRLVLQFKIPYYWSIPGKLHFNLCLALCFAFLMLILGGAVFFTGIMELCAAFGTLTYWFYLAAFFWMSTVTFDTWFTFRPSATFVKVGGTNKSLIKYVLPCWLIPAVIAVVVTCLDLTNIDTRFKPQFGSRVCWFNQRYALLVYFGVPVAILTVLTTIFFILTVISIRKTRNSSVNPTSKKESHNIGIYFRLYVLMGVSWIFGFVAAFVGHEALWIIFIILNASQGILIFISFVVNRTVLSELKIIKVKASPSGTSISTN